MPRIGLPIDSIPLILVFPLGVNTLEKRTPTFRVITNILK